MRARLLMASLGLAGVVAAAAFATCLTTGCSSIDYYTHSIRGHLAVLRAAHPVPEWIASNDTPAALSARARPGVVNGLGIWWRKLGLAGTNVNEVTHQRLTDIGRGPSFYDCLVEVRPAGNAAP